MVDLYNQESASSQSGGGSIVGSLLNPLNYAEMQFLSVWGIPSYLSMMRTGSVSFNPLLGMEFGYGNKLKQSSNIFKKGIGTFMSGFKKDPLSSLAGEIVDASGIAYENKAARVAILKKNLTGVLGKAKWRDGSSKQMYGLVRDAAKRMGISTSVGMETNIAKRMSSAINISRLGAIGSGIFTGVGIGLAVSGTFNLWFKGALTALDTFSAFTNHVRSLEFGGSLSNGYLSTSAATERQRAVREIQRSHVGGRRMLGREATMYSGGM